MQTESGVEEEDLIQRWLIDDADTVKERVETINLRTTPESPCQSFDITQLYTNLDQSDILTKIDELIDLAYNRNAKELSTRQIAARARGTPTYTADDIRLVAYADESKAAHFIVITNADDEERERTTRAKRVMRASELKELVKISIEECYTQVGQNIFKQLRGIPMGMSASPLVADLYLFMYELTFMKQFFEDSKRMPHMTQDQNLAVVREYFSICIRFQDDRWTACNEMEERAMYEERWWGPGQTHTSHIQTNTHPYHGMYPQRFLTITNDPPLYSGTIHQDIEIKRRKTLSGKYYYFCAIYDKKYDGKYKLVRGQMKLYQHPETMLAKSCIYGVVYSELRRFHMRSSDPKEFIHASARNSIRMIANMRYMGHDSKEMRVKLRKFLKTVPQLYGNRKAVFKFTNQIQTKANRMHAILQMETDYE